MTRICITVRFPLPFCAKLIDNNLMRHGLLTVRHPSGGHHLCPPQLSGSETSKDPYFFDNVPFTD